VVVLFFGLSGTLFSGILQPWDLHWAIAALFGFIVVGMTAGALKKTRVGRGTLWLVDTCVVALIVSVIVMAE
jgi:hypothetical protein